MRILLRDGTRKFKTLLLLGEFSKYLVAGCIYREVKILHLKGQQWKDFGYLH